MKTYATLTGPIEPLPCDSMAKQAFPSGPPTHSINRIIARVALRARIDNGVMAEDDRGAVAILADCLRLATRQLLQIHGFDVPTVARLTNMPESYIMEAGR